jgi:hypothetical protein
VFLNDFEDVFVEEGSLAIAPVLAVVKLESDVLDGVLGLFPEIVDGNSRG